MSGEKRGTTNLAGSSFAFGVFHLDPGRRAVSRNGRPLALTPKEFDTLLALVKAEGRLVEKEDLLAQIWNDCHVGDGSLARNISVLRKMLGGGVIKTIPRRGYRLALSVTTVAPAAQAVNPERAARAQYWRWLAYGTLVALLCGIAILANRTSASDAKHLQRALGTAEPAFANYTGDRQDGEGIHWLLDSPLSAQNRNARPIDAEAYQDYLLGRFYWNKRNREGLFKSIEYFERALSRDSSYARAYAGLADAYLVLGGGYLPDVQAYNKGRRAAQRALELDNTLSDAYTSLAYENFVNERDMTGADAAYRRALSLDANSANAHHWYALYLSAMNRPDEAILHINRAVELAPLAVGIRYNASRVYLAAGRREEAVRAAKWALEIDPNSAPAHGTLAAAYAAEGLYGRAIAEFQTAQKLRAGYSAYAIEVAHMYALEGAKDRAQGLLASLVSDSHWTQAAPYNFALTYAALGQKEKAFFWLKRCEDDRSCTASEINNDHGLDPLRSDARFARITR